MQGKCFTTAQHLWHEILIFFSYSLFSPSVGTMPSGTDKAHTWKVLAQQATVLSGITFLGCATLCTFWLSCSPGATLLASVLTCHLGTSVLAEGFSHTLACIVATFTHGARYLRQLSTAKRGSRARTMTGACRDSRDIGTQQHRCFRRRACSYPNWNS